MCMFTRIPEILSGSWIQSLHVEPPMNQLERGLKNEKINP